MTERQITGIWFIITGVLLLSMWLSPHLITSWYLVEGNSLLRAENTAALTDEHLYSIGLAVTMAVQLFSLSGIPFLVTGVSQFIIGMPRKKLKKSNKR